MSSLKSLSSVCQSRIRAGIGAMIAIAVTLLVQTGISQDRPKVDQDGSVHVPAFVLPESSLLSTETRDARKKLRDSKEDEGKACPETESTDPATMSKIRECQANAFYRSKLYKGLRSQFNVDLEVENIGGVRTEVFVPHGGVAPENADRLLINVHGGHFKMGARTISQLESIPISSVGRIKVVSVDYRMSPEYSFPAASEDVAAVYRELLKQYKPQNIGIYGCSAGGLLTAESVAWLEKEGLPLPGAVGMFGGGASYYQEGDSGSFASAREGFQLEPPNVHPYFKKVDPGDALAFPIKSSEIMAKFPPSLLIASTRDIAMSSVVFTHSQLIKLGVNADLHVWEGMDHCFFTMPNLPESRDVDDVVIRFFDRHLGK